MTRAISGCPTRQLAKRFMALGACVEPRAVRNNPISSDAGKALHAAPDEACHVAFAGRTHNRKKVPFRQPTLARVGPKRRRA
jgi:hypothetical protein